MTEKILIVSGHTDLQGNSLANKTILETLQKELLSEAEYSILSDLYPDYQIDVVAEQAKLLEADTIILQYPIFWYSAPSLLHKWLEDVFVFGFSHGDGGEALKGKKLYLSLTTGAPQAAYSKEAGATLEDLLAPIRQTAALTQLDLQDYLVTYGVSYAMRNQPELRQEMIDKAKKHAQNLAKLVK